LAAAAKRTSAPACSGATLSATSASSGISIVIWHEALKTADSKAAVVNRVLGDIR
jgi:hypothetical protein